MAYTVTIYDGVFIDRIPRSADVLRARGYDDPRFPTNINWHGNMVEPMLAEVQSLRSFRPGDPLTVNGERWSAGEMSEGQIGIEYTDGTFDYAFYYATELTNAAGEQRAMLFVADGMGATLSGTVQAFHVYSAMATPSAYLPF